MANSHEASSNEEPVLLLPASEPLPWLGWDPIHTEHLDEKVGINLPHLAVIAVHWLISIAMRGPAQLGARIAHIVQYVIDPLLAFFTGSYYPPVGPLSRRRPICLINNADPNFSVPKLDGDFLYDPAEFPFDRKDADKNGFHEWVVHFLALTIKAAYESEEVIRDIVAREWDGFEFLEAFNTAPDADIEETEFRKIRRAKRLHQQKSLRSKGTVEEATTKQKIVNKVSADLIPETHAFLIKNEHALVLFFRGTEPSKLAEWWSDCDLDPSKPGDLVNIAGRVHQGFYDALFYQPHDLVDEAGNPVPQRSIFNKICTRLHEELSKPGGDQLKVYITGHSLGGGLTSVFAHTLAHPGSKPSNRPKGLPLTVGFDSANLIYPHVGGVVSWAGPLAGNHDFAEFVIQNYQGKVFRMVHSSDIVTKIPAGLGYYHHPQEYFIAYNGDIYSDAEEIEAWRILEGDFFDLFYLQKALYGWTRFAPTGVPSGLPFMPSHVAWLTRNLARTFLRILFYFLGFIVPGHTASGVTDHWPCDYEQKVRVAALALGEMKKTPREERSKLSTTLMSRTRHT